MSKEGRAGRSIDIPSLDGIRAVAWFIVFVSHALPRLHLPGQFGVTVFFFLSGYLITTLLRLEIERSATVDLGAFYVRRALRILPPFYTVLVGSIAIGLARGAHPSGGALAALALHYVNYFVIARSSWEGLPDGTAVYWSLAVEEHFYLLFPAAFLLLQRLRNGRSRAIALWAVSAVVLAWRCWLALATHAPQIRTFIASDTRIDSILFGCALAVWGNPALDASTAAADRLWRRILLPLGAGLLVVCFALGDWIPFRESVRYSLQGVGLIPVFVCAVRFPEWGLFRQLNRPLARWVGDLSYSLYLVHVVLLTQLERARLPQPLVALFGLAASLAAAAAIRRFIELPAARLRRRYARTVAPAPAIAASAAR